MKTCILQMADAGPVESTEIMLNSVGYRCFLPNNELRRILREIGCKVVLSPSGLTRQLGYDPVSIPEIGPEGMETCDIYCDIKAHQCHDKIVNRWPRLKGKVLWTRIQGGRPEHAINYLGDHGDEVNPPCPILTPNRWYAQAYEECSRCEGSRESPPGEPCWECGGDGEKKVPWYNLQRYSCWPPFRRMDEYRATRDLSKNASPMCLLHNARGWGYGDLFEPFRAMGVRIYGAGSPDGVLQHRNIPLYLSESLAMVHLKSSDAPGYAIYESLSAACPLIVTRRLIWKNRMEDLLIPGETCLAFDREGHQGLTEDDVKECVREVKEHLERLRDPAENRRIGEAGRRKLEEVMWSKDRPADVASLKEFMTRNFV